MDLKSKKIGFGITASYCTYNAVLPEIQKLVDEGAEVYPVLSPNALTTDTRFGKASEYITRIESICSRSIMSTIVETEPFGPKAVLDAMVVAPCTGNTLSKLANGITDNSVTMACKAQLRNQRPVIIAISTNDGLGINAKNLGLLLNARNIYFVPFEQDDPLKKCSSLVSKFDLIVPTIIEALKGNQLQPLLL